MSNDVDFLVIGAGACGLCAAIAAADAGLSTAIVEKTDRPGGNSALSTGSVPAAGSRFQKEAGIDDDAETYFRDLMNIAGETDDPDLVRRMTEVSAETVEWLVDTVKARIELVTAYKHIGHSVPRLHAPVSRRGSDLVHDLLRAVEERGIPLAVGNTVKRLILENNRVAGAVIDTGDGEEIEFRAGATLLALNGFGANQALVEKFTPEIAGAQYFGAVGSDGEAVLWGEALGARLINMEAIKAMPRLPIPMVVFCHGRRLKRVVSFLERMGAVLGMKAWVIPALPSMSWHRGDMPMRYLISGSSRSRCRRRNSPSCRHMAA